MHNMAIISTSDLISDIPIMFLNPNFLYDAKIFAIQPQIRAILHLFAAHARNGSISTFARPVIVGRQNNVKMTTNIVG